MSSAPQPRTAILETFCFRITRHCNLACSHCRAGSSPRTREYGSVDDLLRFARLAQAELGLKHISITGGEPAIDPRLPALVAALASFGLHVSVTTNGTVAISQMLQPAIEVFPDRIRVRVSIDGSEPLHDALRGAGSFRRAVAELRSLRELFGWVAINSVITEALLPAAPQLAGLAASCAVPEWALIVPVPQGSASRRPWTSDRMLPIAHAFRDRVRWYGYAGRLRIWDFLGSPHTSVLVEPNGDVTLSGIRDDDSIVITTLASCDLGAVAAAIDEATRLKSRCHFSWSGWS